MPAIKEKVNSIHDAPAEPSQSKPSDSSTQFEALRQLHEDTLRIARIRDWSAALQEILSSAVRAHGADKGLLALANDSFDGLDVVASRKFSDRFLSAVPHLAAGFGASGLAFKERRRVLIEDTELDPVPADFKGLAKLGGFRACHSTPLTGADGIIRGVLSIHFADPHRAGQHEIWLLDLYARMASDFIERFQIERREREAEHQHHQLLQALPTPVYTCDADGRLTSFNEAAAALWGRRPKLGEDFWYGSLRTFKPDGTPLPLEECPMAITLREGHSVRGQEIIVERPDGSRLHVLPHPDPILDSAGNLIGAVNTLIDITAIKNKDLEIRRQKEQLRAIIENTTECVKVVDIDGSLLDMNAAGLAVCEAESLDLLAGKSIFDLIAAEDRESFQAMHGKVCSGSCQTLQFRLVGLKGNLRWMETYAMPFADPMSGRTLHLAVTRDITARRKEEDAARLLSAIVESSEDAIASKSLDGTITSWNRSAERLFGYTAAEAIGRSVTMLIPEDRLDEEPAILSRICAGERIEHYETIRQHKDGTRLNISLTVSPIKDEKGRVVGASKIARDISRRKQSEEALRKRTRLLEIINRNGASLAAELNIEKLLQIITDAATQAAGAKFGAFFYNELNDQGESYMLYTLSGASREAFEKFGQPRATPIFAPTFRGERVVRSGDITKEPAYGKMAPHFGMPKGHLPVRSYLAVPVVSRSGEVFGGLFFAHPDADVFTEETEQIITGLAGQAAVALDNARLYTALQNELEEHKKAEIALRASESQFRSLSESLPQIVWTARPDGSVDYFNSRWYEFTGAPRESGDENWVLWLHPEDVQKCLDSWTRSVRSGEPYEIEYRFKEKATGKFRWHLGRALPVRNDAGEITKWLGTCTDIEDQKRAAEVLEQAVAERTASLREAIAQMEEFSYSVSHDLRAPLRAIDGYTRILTTDYAPRFDAEVNDFLAKISRNINRIQRLINDVLTLSRVARTEVELQPVELRSLISEIIEQNPPLQPPFASIEAGDLNNVSAHDVLLSQALTNILHNAVKFVAPGVIPQIKIWTVRRDGAVRIWIQDNGIGIRPEYQPKLFGMFQRLSQNQRYEGTGIGLAIVRKSVERMGGSVGVESNGVDGSKFWIELRGTER